MKFGFICNYRAALSRPEGKISLFLQVCYLCGGVVPGPSWCSGEHRLECMDKNKWDFERNPLQAGGFRWVGTRSESALQKSLHFALLLLQIVFWGNLFTLACFSYTQVNG